MAKKLINPEFAVVHKSASDRSSHDNIETIDGWHKERGFCFIDHDGKKRHVGYHFLIQKNGNIQRGRPLDVRGAHCYRYNSRSIGICLAGDKVFNKVQRDSLHLLLEEIEDFLGYPLIRKGHCELDRRPEKRNCPQVSREWFTIRP